jgi:hypothetical protein
MSRLQYLALNHAWTSFVVSGILVAAGGCVTMPDDGASAAASDAPTTVTASGEATSPVDPLRRFVAGQWRQFVHFDAVTTAARATDDKSAESAAPVQSLSVPTSVSLRPYMTPVRDQGSRGTCVEFASSGAIEYYTGGDISEQAMVYFNGGNNGANLQYRLGDFLKFGLVDEKLAEYDLTDMNLHVPRNQTYAQMAARSGLNPMQPLSEVIHAVSGTGAIDFIKSSIAAGTPVVFGMFIPDGTMATGTIATPASPKCNNVTITSDNIGECPGHAMIFTGYNDATQQLEVKNQWGTGWGNGGYGQMTYDFFIRYQAGNLMTIAFDSTAIGNLTTSQQIQAVYQHTIGRNAMDWEVDAWINNLKGGWTIASMTSAFEQNAQFDDAIDAVYEEAFGREPAAWELAAWETNIRSNGWTITSMRNAFEQPSQAEFNVAITTVYQQTFNRDPATSELNAWQTYIPQDNWTIPKMRNAFADSPECLSAIDNGFLIVLGRHATSAELRTYQLHVRDDGWSIAQVKAAL